MWAKLICVGKLELYLCVGETRSAKYRIMMFIKGIALKHCCLFPHEDWITVVGEKKIMDAESLHITYCVN